MGYEYFNPLPPVSYTHLPPRAGTGVNDHHITLADGFGQLLPDQFQIIRQNRITASDTIIFRDQIFKHPGIGFYNFPIFQWFRIFNHLITGRNDSDPVSYTHLDVYKRQCPANTLHIRAISS